MTDITIPPEASQAAWSAFVMCNGSSRDAVDAAARAMLANWPGAVLDTEWMDGVATLILPLTETTNE
jgi:hypothetical protein